MSITTTSFRIALAAAALCAVPSVASADGARRVVILNFDGPQGDTTRNAVVELLGEKYDVVATKRWTDARKEAEAHLHGPAMWLAASRKSGVDAVITGWTQAEGKHFTLTMEVLEAASGKAVDTLNAKVTEKGLTPDSTVKLETNLEQTLEEVYGSSYVAHPLPTIKVGIDGDSKRKKDTEVAIVDDDDVKSERASKKKAKDADDDDKPSKSKKVKDDDADDKPSKSKKDKDETADKDDKEKDAKATEVAVVDKPGDLNSVFSNDPLILQTVLPPKEIHISRPTPKWAIDGGFFYGTRSFTLVADNPDLIQYPGNPQQGVQISATVYPWPTQKMDGQLSGFGASFSVGHSIGSSVTFTDDDGTNGEYVVQTTSWEAGLHYRWPFEMGSLDASVTYGNQSLAIEDAPQSLETPDTQYTYVGVGGHADLKITDRASVGFGAHYMFVLDAGDAVSTDWYGPGSASGLQLDADFVVPLPMNLYIRGEIKYTRINIDFVGVGGQFDDDGVQSATDTTIQASANVGVNF